MCSTYLKGLRVPKRLKTDVDDFKINPLILFCGAQTAQLVAAKKYQIF